VRRASHHPNWDRSFPYSIARHIKKEGNALGHISQENERTEVAFPSRVILESLISSNEGGNLRGAEQRLFRVESFHSSTKRMKRLPTFLLDILFQD
jgi:hypothetical protein